MFKWRQSTRSPTTTLRKIFSLTYYSEPTKASELLMATILHLLCSEWSTPRSNWYRHSQQKLPREEASHMSTPLRESDLLWLSRSRRLMNPWDRSCMFSALKQSQIQAAPKESSEGCSVVDYKLLATPSLVSLPFKICIAVNRITCLAIHWRTRVLVFGTITNSPARLSA